MDIVKSDHRVECFNSSIVSAYLPGKTVGVLDIETLGLNGDYSPMILAGLMKIDAFGNATITQFFADDPKDEKELVHSLLENISKCDYLLTYNGKHFDVPFICKRCKKYALSPSPLPYNLDLYLFIKVHSHLKNTLPNLKQKTVERYMGLESLRDDEISGSQSIQLYKNFLNEPSREEKQKIKRQILLHNHDDILQLYKLMPILQNTDIHKGFFYNGFVVSGQNSWPSVEVKNISVGANSLFFSGTCLSKTSFEYTNYFSTEHPFECCFREDHSFSFRVPTKKVGKSVYIDLTEHFDYETIAESFDFLPECVNNFLILTDQGVVKYGAINKYIMSLIASFMSESQFPA